MTGERVRLLVAVLMLAACDPNAACKSIQVGRNSPVELTRSGQGLWTVGTAGTRYITYETTGARKLWCCAITNMAGCTGVDTSSCDAEVKIYAVDGDYSYNDGYHSSTQCEVAAKDGIILGVMSIHGE